MHIYWNEFFFGRKNGINVAVVDEVNGSVVSMGNFNPDNRESTELGKYIERIPPGRIVCVAISGNGVHELSEYAKRSMMWLGSNRIHNLQEPHSWALIGVKGSHMPHQQSIEMSGTNPAHVTTRINFKSMHQQFFEITAISAGLRSGKYANITLNRSVVEIPYVGYDRGLHVMMVDEASGIITETQVFDTSAESGAHSSSDQFISLIEAQPQGRLVAIAIKEEAIAHMSDDAKRACESIGSALIWRVGHGDSWAIVGRKGAKIGSVPEAMHNTGVAKSKLVLSKPDGDGVLCPILIRSSETNGIGSSITVNGTRISALSKGNLIAVLNEDNCTVDKNLSFTSSDNLFGFIKPLLPGRVVLVNLAIDYRDLSDYAQVALEAIGSATARGQAFGAPWAIIGKKGAPIGSVAEDASYSEPGKSLGATIKVGNVLKVVTVKSAGSSAGNYGTIEVGAYQFPMSPVYECGLNVVVFEGSTSNVNSSQTFNMTISNSSQDFMELTESLPNGTMIALASNNAGDLNQNVKSAIKELGSKYIGRAVDGGCWAFLGRKGGQQGEVLEAISDHGPVEIVSHAMSAGPDVEDSSYCKIFIESAGTGNVGGLKIYVNGHYNETLLSSEGVIIAIMKERSCELESITSQYTYSWNHHIISHMSSLIKMLPMGRIVIASVFATSSYGRYYHPAALKYAMDLIGSSLFRRAQYRDTWAIIGRKGAPTSSVPESLLIYSGGVSNPVVSLSGIMKLAENKPKLCEKSANRFECLE